MMTSAFDKIFIFSIKFSIFKRKNFFLQFQMSVSLLHDYVKNVGTKFIYSQKCIDLVQQYMDHFPRVFEVLSNSDTAAIPISDFDENNNNENGFEYIRKIREWLRTLPHSKERLKPIDLMHLSDGAIREVRKAVTESVSFPSIFIYIKIHIQKTAAIVFLNFSIKVHKGTEDAQAQNEVAKSLHSRYEQCVCRSMFECSFQAPRSHCYRSQWLSGMNSIFIDFPISSIFKNFLNFISV